jgi:hypothetical protein
MIDRHWDSIAAYCKPENKVSLGFVEDLNNKIRVIQRRPFLAVGSKAVFSIALVASLRGPDGEVAWAELRQALARQEVHPAKRLKGVAADASAPSVPGIGVATAAPRSARKFRARSASL